MKKLLVLFILAALSINVMSACNVSTTSGSEQTDNISNQTSESMQEEQSSDADYTQANIDEDMLKNGYLAYEYIKSKINENDYDGDIDTYEYDGKEYPYIMNLKDDKMLEYNFNTVIDMGNNSKISLPCSFDDLEKAGWQCSEESKNKLVDGVTEGYFNSAHALLINFQNSDGKRISAGLCNYDKSQKKISECTCTYITLSVDSEECPDFSIEEGINKNLTSLDDVISKLGEPTTYKFSKDTCEISVCYNQKSNSANSLSFSFLYDSTADTTNINCIKISSDYE